VNLYIYADPESPAASLYSDVGATSPLQFPELVVGDTVSLNVYLIDGTGGYDDRSGGAGYIVAVSLGDPTQTISGGTFALTHSTNSTGQLAWNITADSLQTALNALPSVTAAGGLTVSGVGGLFLVTWTTTGTKTEFGASGDSLIPFGAVEISTTNDGTAGHKTQIIQLMPASLCTQSTFAQITKGWAGQISTNTLPAIQDIAGAAFKNKLIQISIIGSGGAVMTQLQMPVVLRNRISGSSSSPFHAPEVSFTELDPVFSASEAASFVSGDKAKLDSVYSWGNHSIAGYATRSYVQCNFLPLSGGTLTGPLGIGGFPTPCAALTVDSTTRGVLFPRMTQAQRDTIVEPLPGLLIWQTNNSEGFRYFTGSAWIPLAQASVGTFVCIENGLTYGIKVMIAGGDDNKPYIEPYLIG